MSLFEHTVYTLQTRAALINSEPTPLTRSPTFNPKIETYGRYLRISSQALASTSPPFPASTARHHNQPLPLSREPITRSPSPDITNRLHNGWGTYRQSPSPQSNRPHFDSQESLGLGNYPPLTFHRCESDPDADSLGHTIQPPTPSSIESQSAPFDASVSKELELPSTKLVCICRSLSIHY